MTEGSGPPLPLLHQATLSSEEYSLVIPVLGKSYRVIAMDFPGYGSSDRPPREYLVEDYAGSVITFLDSLGIKRTSIVGNHSGAAVATEVAATHPERVDRLVLSGCPLYTPEERQARLIDPKYRPMEIKEDGSHLTQLWEATKSVSRSSLSVWHRMLVNHLMAGEGNHDIHRAVFQYPIEQRLPLIKSPTLFVCREKEFSDKLIQTTKIMVPQSEVKVIKGSSGRLLLEKPNEFAQAVLEFLNKAPRHQ